MTIYLKQSTASQEVTLGYFLDSTDGNTEETGLTIANTDIKLHKAGATTLANKNSGGATHISNGIYYAVLDATDTDTLGSLVIYCHPTGASATRVECVVLAANVYDSMIGGGDTLDVQVTGMGANVMTDLVDAVWDEGLTGGTHNVPTSAGRRLRQIDASFEVHDGTAQAGTSTTITLDTGASATDDIYNGDRIVLSDGAGAQEHGIIIDYNGTTKVATMSKAWVVTPDATSVFTIIPADCNVETWNNSTTTGDGDWAELQTDVDAIKVKTDQLVFTKANELDINLKSVNGVTVNGDGSGTPMGV